MRNNIYSIPLYSKEDDMAMLEKIQRVGVFVREQGVVEVGDVMKEFAVTRSTAFRYLRDDRFLTSINQKGKYHIEAADLKFNRHGLFNRNGMIFSIHGNLLRTVVALISNSAAGMRASEVSRLVGTSVYTQCQALFRDNLLCRRKEGRGYRYFSAEAEKRKQQLSASKRKTSLDVDSALQNESVESLHEVIKILVAYVSNPALKPKSIALSLTRRGTSVATETVRAVFDRYGLSKKNS